MSHMKTKWPLDYSVQTTQKARSITLHQRVVSLLLLIVLQACASTAPVADNTDSKSGLKAYTQDIFEISEKADRAYKESRWSEAAQHYQSLTVQVPNDAYIWFRLANTLAQKGDYDEAVYAYQQSIERDALQPKPWFNLSTAYLLNAKQALQQAWSTLRSDDPARQLIEIRIEIIDDLLNSELG